MFVCTHLQGMKHADFIIEAVVEDEKVKRSIFQQLDKVGVRRALAVWLAMCEIAVTEPNRQQQPATSAEHKARPASRSRRMQ